MFDGLNPNYIYTAKLCLSARRAIWCGVLYGQNPCSIPLLSQYNPRGIHIQMLPYLSPTDKEFLLYKYNLVRSENSVPAAWWAAALLPLLKPGKDCSLTASYQLINLTSCVSKMMERMVNCHRVYTDKLFDGSTGCAFVYEDHMRTCTHAHTRVQAHARMHIDTETQNLPLKLC